MIRPLLLPLACLATCLAQQALDDRPPAPSADPGQTILSLSDESKLDAITAAFRDGYGEDFKGVTRNEAGKTVFRFKAAEFLYEDGRDKTFAERLADPDIEDTFRPVYPLPNPTDTLPENFDPGRFRVEALFKTLYGATEAEVAKNCVTVDFCGNKVRFNARCGAAKALGEVGKELDGAIKAKPALKAYLTNLGGTVQWRFIAGTKQLSNHSFGTAIDLNVDKSAYWRWEKPDKLKTFTRKDWPVEIIAAFERHGFIWGGKWWHFDTMHFEYRPELIHFARSQAGAPAEAGAPPGEGEKKRAPAPHEFLEPLKE